MRKQALIPVVLLVAAILFPFVFSNPTVTSIAVFTLMFAAMATSWNIFAGYTGYIALGHAAFFGTGAYVLANLCQIWNVPGGYLPFLLLPVCGLVASAVAIPLGAMALRARGHTFVVITIAIFFIFFFAAPNLRGITHGNQPFDLPIPPWSGGFYNLPFYFVALAVLVCAFITSWFVRSSKYGLGLLAIRDDEDRARGLGVHTFTSKLVAFAVSAFFVGMAGALWAYFEESIQPAFAFQAINDVAVALMVFLGGVGTLSGPILGALILEPAQQYFTFQYGQLYLVVYGALFLVVILLLPQGIVPTLRQYWTRLRAPRSPIAPPVAAPPSGATATATAGTGEGAQP